MTNFITILCQIVPFLHGYFVLSNCLHSKAVLSCLYYFTKVICYMLSYMLASWLKLNLVLL